MSIRTSYSESSNGLPPAAIIDPENFSELDKQEDLDVSPISNEDSQKLKPYAACNALIEAGRFDEALIAAEALAEMGEKDVALSNLCEALAKADRFDEIPPIAEIISNKHRRCLVFRKLCKDLTIAGHFEKARQIAWEYIDDMYSQSYALADICKAKAKAGQVIEALEIAETILDENQKWRAFSDISKALAKIGDAEGSIKVARMILNETEMSLTLEHASKKLIEIDLNKALQVTNIMPPGYCKRRALELIVKALELAGDNIKAKEIEKIIYSLPNPYDYSMNWPSNSIYLKRF